jgi:hypothetical protein
MGVRMGLGEPVLTRLLLVNPVLYNMREFFVGERQLSEKLDGKESPPFLGEE